MKILSALNESSDTALDAGERYLKRTKEYYELKMFKQIAIGYSFLVKLLLIGGLIFIGVVFLSISTVDFLGKWVGSDGLAWLLLGGIYFFVALIIYLLRKKIDGYIVKKLSLLFF